MKNSMEQFIFIALRILAWILFVGLSIEAGGLLVNFVFSVFGPENVRLLYEKMDLQHLKQGSAFHYYAVYSLLLFLALGKSYLFYRLTQLTHHINLTHPFSEKVVRTLQQITTSVVSLALVGYVAKDYLRQIEKWTVLPPQVGTYLIDPAAFLVMGAMLTIISIIFRRGVELQNENDLTV